MGSQPGPTLEQKREAQRLKQDRLAKEAVWYEFHRERARPKYPKTDSQGRMYCKVPNEGAVPITLLIVTLPALLMAGCLWARTSDIERQRPGSGQITFFACLLGLSVLVAWYFARATKEVWEAPRFRDPDEPSPDGPSGNATASGPTAYEIAEAIELSRSTRPDAWS